MLHYGIRGNLLQCIRSFLANCSQHVLVDGSSSSSSPVISGVPQGSVLGPLLFLIYINDLPSKVVSTSRLFADDSLLYRKIRSIENTKTLQDDLDNLQKWKRDWGMTFNPSKCEVIRITRRRNSIHANYNIHGQQLSIVESGKYLNVNISKGLSWNSHVAQYCNHQKSLQLPPSQSGQLPSKSEGLMLQDTDQTNPWVCELSMGPSLYCLKHQPTWSRAAQSSKVCYR